MNADGSNQTQLYRAGGGTSDFLPIWSPDGANIFFSQSNSEITAPSSLMRFIVNVDQTPQRMENIPLPIVDVTFSSDGAWIAYESPNTKNIYIYNLIDKAPPAALLDDSELNIDPAWRPAPTQ